MKTPREQKHCTLSYVIQGLISGKVLVLPKKYYDIYMEEFENMDLLQDILDKIKNNLHISKRPGRD